jgi:hypothetical protein
VRFAWFVFLTIVFAACSRPPPDATPEGAIKTWLERMAAQVSDPAETKSAYAMLSKSTHQNLEKRAERASRIEGRRIGPEEMLAQGRFALRFTPRKFSTQTSGDTATVEVSGDEPADHSTLHCVKEGAVWRVDLTLPDLIELPRRQDNQ